MKRLAMLFLSVSMVLVVACKKEESKPAEGGAKPTTGDKAAGKGDKAAAPAAVSCPEGALKSDEFGFCLKFANDKYKEIRRDKQMGTDNITFADPATPDDGVYVTVYPKDKEGHFKNQLMTPDMISQNAANKNVEKADLPGGVKYIAHDSEWGDHETFAAGAGTKAAGITCGTRHSTAFPKPDLDSVCKTLVVF